MSNTRFTLILALGCAACGPANEAEPGGRELPQPSGPPIVQQAEPEQDKPTVTPATPWRARDDALELVSAETTVLTIACRGGNLIVSAPGFTPIGSEDRFAFGLGTEPVTLVADPTRQSRPGVTAEGPVPENFAELWRRAERISALYGTQRVGPEAAPPPALAQNFLQSCR